MVLLGYLALLGRILLLGYERVLGKQLSEKRDSEIATFVFFFVAALLMLPLLFFVKWPSSYGFIWLALLSGLVYTAAFLLYLRALSIGEISLIGPLYHFNIFFLLVLAVVFLGESLTPFKVAGLVMLVYGISLLNRKGGIVESLRGLTKDPACAIMMVSSLLMAVGRTIDGFNVQSVDPMLYSVVVYFLICFFTFLYLAWSGKLSQIIPFFAAQPKTAIAAGFTNAYTYVFLMIAFTEIEVSVAEPASMLGAVVTVLFGGLFFKEKIKDRFLAAGILVIGAWMLFIRI